MQHEFEDIEIKENAIELLELSLRHKRKPCMIGTGSMTDPYISIEKQLRYVRKTLELIYKYRFGFTVITKSALILRDIELLRKINEQTKCVIQMTLTTADPELCKILEPDVSCTAERFEALKRFRDEGIPTVVWLTPVLPFINDTEENIRSILDMCIEAKVQGIICFNMGLTLREGNREYFYQKLDIHFNGLKEKYMKIYGENYFVNSPDNNRLMKMFHDTCQRYGIMHDNDKIFRYLSQFEDKEEGKQLSLF